jgi:hypothetical protein
MAVCQVASLMVARARRARGGHVALGQAATPALEWVRRAPESL